MTSISTSTFSTPICAPKLPPPTETGAGSLQSAPFLRQPANPRPPLPPTMSPPWTRAGITTTQRASLATVSGISPRKSATSRVDVSSRSTASLRSDELAALEGGGLFDEEQADVSASAPARQGAAATRPRRSSLERRTGVLGDGVMPMAGGPCRAGAGSAVRVRSDRYPLPTLTRSLPDGREAKCRSKRARIDLSTSRPCTAPYRLVSHPRPDGSGSHARERRPRRHCGRGDASLRRARVRGHGPPGHR